jgi:hypothetical protein
VILAAGVGGASIRAKGRDSVCAAGAALAAVFQSYVNR